MQALMRQKEPKTQKIQKKRSNCPGQEAVAVFLQILKKRIEFLGLPESDRGVLFLMRNALFFFYKNSMTLNQVCSTIVINIQNEKNSC